MSDETPPKRKRRRIGCLPIFVILVAVIGLALAIALRPAPLAESRTIAAPKAQALAPAPAARLRAVAEFDSIADPAARSLALFEEAGRVIQHPRCMNCHPRTDRPTQTEAMRPHMPWVTRGPDGHGDEALKCSTCHHAENFAASGVPGHPKWALAPPEMAWQGKTLGEICRQMLDPARSHMTREQLRKHMAEDSLVGWAWNPGGDRQPAPGTQAAFGELVTAWLETGAKCPT